MLSESYLIDLIKNKTTYTNVDYSEDISTDIITRDYTTPKISVGHRGIKLKDPEFLFANAYSELDNHEILITEIQILCLRSSLSTVRDNIRAAYFGESPYPNDSNYSSLFFIEANVVAKTNKNIWWSEMIGLLMPRIS